MAKKLDELGMSFPYMVGPMVGLSHVAFRELIRWYTPPNIKLPLFSEMLSTLRLPSERLDLSEDLRITDRDRGEFIPQILGNDEWYIERSVKKLQDLEPWGIDINMGCPVKKTLRHNWGVRLMGEPSYAAKVVELTRKHYKGPLSVKMRVGLKNEDESYILNFTKALEEAGADWITIHARLQSQKHRGSANWDLLRGIKAERSIPVVGNGDIQTADDAIGMIDNYGLDGAMLGRAATARPWIFWQIAEKLGMDIDLPPGARGEKAPTSDEEGLYYIDGVIRFLDFLNEHSDNHGKKLRKFRFYVVHSHRWYTFGHSFYSRCMKHKDLDQLRDVLVEYRDSVASFPMSQRITLL